MHGSRWLPLGFALVAGSVLTGAWLVSSVAAGDSPQPLVVEPDAPHEKGVEVATFALG
jgi:hypothetical protein